eukprot:s1161_g16.t1
MQDGENKNRLSSCFRTPTPADELGAWQSSSFALWLCSGIWSMNCPCLVFSLRKKDGHTVRGHVLLQKSGASRGVSRRMDAPPRFLAQTLNEFECFAGEVPTPL